MGAYLEEGLDLALLLDLLLGHTFRHHFWVSINAGDQSVSKRFVSSAFIVRFDNDGFAASIASCQDKDDLVRFHNLTHFEEILCVVSLRLMIFQAFETEKEVARFCKHKV